VAINRLYNYLLSDEIDPDNVIWEGSYHSVSFKNEQQGESFSLLHSKASRSKYFSILFPSRPSGSPKLRISVSNGYFSWTKDAAKEVLSDINLKLYEGELIMVVGQVKK